MSSLIYLCPYSGVASLSDTGLKGGQTWEEAAMSNLLKQSQSEQELAGVLTGLRMRPGDWGKVLKPW